MRFVCVTAILPLLLTACCLGQLSSSSTERTVAQTVRSKYYNLQASGFQGLICTVDFDFSTIPLLSPDTEDPNHKLLRKTIFSLRIDEKGRPTFQHEYPHDSTEAEQARAAQVTGLLDAFVTGVFNTWPTKGLQGPIPPFDSQVEGTVVKNDGYTIGLLVPGAPVEVEVDKNYLVQSITSDHGRVVELPIYSVSDEGLVFTGNRAIDRSDATNPTEVKYDLGLTSIEGLKIPSSVHLQVNKNIDVKYALRDCSVKKGTVIHLSLPRAETRP